MTAAMNECALPARRDAAASAGGFLPTLLLTSAAFWSLVGVVAVRVIG